MVSVSALGFLYIPAQSHRESASLWLSAQMVTESRMGYEPSHVVFAGGGVCMKHHL